MKKISLLENIIFLYYKVLLEHLKLFGIKKVIYRKLNIDNIHLTYYF